MDSEKIKQGVKLIIEGIGENPKRPGIVDTPRRVADMYEEIFSGMEQDPSDIIRLVPDEQHDEIVLLKDIPFYSICEHHMLPFLGKAHLAYIPKGHICGLSKLARVVELYARRLQLQERLTTQIADAVMELLNPRGVMVIIEAEHLCMTMRGVKKPGSITTTSVVRGLFRKNAATRAEALALIKR
jgi:GTP cyclohydrolase I